MISSRMYGKYWNLAIMSLARKLKKINIFCFRLKLYSLNQNDCVPQSVGLKDFYYHFDKSVSKNERCRTKRKGKWKSWYYQTQHGEKFLNIYEDSVIYMRRNRVCGKVKSWNTTICNGGRWPFGARQPSTKKTLTYFLRYD